jgi:hypothetical protein
MFENLQLQSNVTSNSMNNGLIKEENSDKVIVNTFQMFILNMPQVEAYLNH